MSFYKAKKALVEIRANHITAKTDPVNWDFSLALEEIAKELDTRLGDIEQSLKRIEGKLR